MMLIACAAECEGGYLAQLRRKAKAEGIDFLFHILKPFTWAGLVRWELEIAKSYPNERIVFVDAWDFLMLGTKAELETIVNTFDLLYHSDNVCWPEPHKADSYRVDRDTEFRYVNGTGPTGVGSVIAEAIEFGLDNFPVRGEESSIFADNDQRFWTDVFLSGRGEIDTECWLSASLNAVNPSEYRVFDKRLVMDNGSMPVFAHLNGGTREGYIEILRGLQCV